MQDLLIYFLWQFHELLWDCSDIYSDISKLSGKKTAEMMQNNGGEYSEQTFSCLTGNTKLSRPPEPLSTAQVSFGWERNNHTRWIKLKQKTRDNRLFWVQNQFWYLNFDITWYQYIPTQMLSLNMFISYKFRLCSKPQSHLHFHQSIVIFPLHMIGSEITEWSALRLTFTSLSSAELLLVLCATNSPDGELVGAASDFII